MTNTYGAQGRISDCGDSLKFIPELTVQRIILQFGKLCLAFREALELSEFFTFLEFHRIQLISPLYMV